MKNFELAKIFSGIADYLEFDDIAFKPRAYRRVAQYLENTAEDMAKLYHEGGKKALADLPTIGSGIADKIAEYIETGKISLDEALKKKCPVKLEELLAIEGIGPKTVRKLYDELHVRNLSDLQKVVQRHKIATLRHFGNRSEAKIRHAIELYLASKGRMLLGEVMPLARRIIARLRAIAGVKRIDMAGSLRRFQETVGDMDLIASSKDQESFLNVFTHLPEVKEVMSFGPTRASVRLKIGIDADMLVIPDEQYGSALLYFTGDKRHNVHLRTIAHKKGMKLNEYGLWKGKKRIAGSDEKSVYEALGMRWMDPELRTDTGEIEASLQGVLPALLTLKDVKGDCQLHTTFSDGMNTPEEMTRKAILLGYEYIMITDHILGPAIADAVKESRITSYLHAVKSCSNEKIQVFAGGEVDIEKDGKLKVSDEKMARFDGIVAAVHSSFRMTGRANTKRLIVALRNPHVRILGHPTARKIFSREPIECDWKQVFTFAKMKNKAIEINASPERLDLHDTLIRMAKEIGVSMILCSDSHAVAQMDQLEMGVGQARRGWAEKKDIINTQNAKDFEKWLHGR
ncbi:MAG: DNA polymerase/3'-5' exonuclease PolX [Parcubacteria group bacterium]|nr:DNA polymerase/3'-5' exonuclease PolX [Parcubacteria group bacterium]